MAVAAFDLAEEGDRSILRLKGDWTLDAAAALSSALEARSHELKQAVTVELADLGRIDVAGAYLIEHAVRGKEPIEFRGEHPAARRLIQVAHRAARKPFAPGVQPNAVLAFLENTGRSLVSGGKEGLESLSFFGQTLATFGRLLMRPTRIRWVSVVHTMELAGLNAMPIIALLSFFIGVVVAYLSARTLSDFGVSVFTVELVGFSVFREFAVVITAVLLAGRTDSAFTAEIGAMKMRQEIDAMRVMGLDPLEALVVPRMIAMVVMTPILTFTAMVAGLLGGLLACWAYLHVTPAMFFERIRDNVPAQHFWVGMSKAPVFALVLAVVGCRHGLQVEGDVGSLGRRVTYSVVEAISVIIALDAIFAVWFLQVNL
jgi:phospholipid/cholesterol/gamma-HCH transport system permease protein